MTMHRVVGSVVLSVLTLATTLGFGGVAPAAAAASAPITIGLTALAPSTAVKSDTLRLSGSLNAGSGAERTDVVVRLAVADMAVRSDLASSAGSASRVVFGHDDLIGSVSAKTTTPWSLTVPISDLALPGRGVYALDVEAWSPNGRISSLRTYLPYEMSGDSSFTPTQLVLLWPVTGAAEFDGHSVNDVPEAVGDQLSTDFAPGGRLDKVISSVGSVKNVVVSWAVDPALLRTAYSESYGYTLYPNQTAGTGGENAAHWLDEARAVLGQSGELWQLPATDPDLGALSTADPAFAAQSVRSAADLSGTTVAELTGRAARGTLAWPADGQADPGTLKLAAALDPAATVVASDSVNLHTRSDTYTPTGHAELSNGTHLAISDAGLDAVFAGDSIDAPYRAGSDVSLLAAQRFLAESAVIALERPNLTVGRTIMVTAPRGGQPDDELLGALSRASWLKPVGLSALLGAPSDPTARTSTPKRAATATAFDLTSRQLAAGTSLNDSLQSLASILAGSSAKVTDSYGPAVLRTVSTSWRGQAAAQTAFSAAVSDRLMSSVNAVGLVPKSDLTLSGKSGVIPFTIENKLSYPVRVGIRITTDRPGLSAPSVAVQTVPQGSTTVNVHVHASVTGAKVMVTAQLVTPTGATYGGARSVRVTVSSIGSITLVIFGLSAALLVIAVVLRIYRGRRPRGAQPEAVASGESVDMSAAADADREE